MEARKAATKRLQGIRRDGVNARSQRVRRIKETSIARQLSRILRMHGQRMVHESFSQLREHTFEEARKSKLKKYQERQTTVSGQLDKIVVLHGHRLLAEAFSAVKVHAAEDFESRRREQQQKMT